MPKTSWIARWPDRRAAFTLIELLVAMAVLVLLITVIAQMTSGLSSVIGLGDAHIDTDTQARALLDRMAIDFGAMIKRPDVDYYLKGRPSALTQTGNDQIAFYSEVPGYFPTSVDRTAQSSTSLVAYRINSTTLHLERFCKGLLWNGATESGSGQTKVFPMGFLPVPLAAPLPSPLPSPLPASTPAPICTDAADPNVANLNYEEMGPQVFRFEYYYVLKGQTATNTPALLSITPWYVKDPVDHTSVNGMQDVAGIGVIIAVIDQKDRKLVSAAQLTTLAGLMEDAPSSFTSPGDIEQQWQTKIDGSGLPKNALAAIRIYSRSFYLNGVSP